jgi:leader peptidase (prepilin peptidase)/N-methyltransferase
METEIIPYLSIILFFFGLLIGSFLNVVAFRTLIGESIAFPPSHCTSCGHQLKPFDLVPLLSYILLRGTCRYCRQSVTPAYFWGELATGLLFAWAGWMWGWQWETVVALFIISILVVIVQTDFRAMIIPNRIIAFGVAIGVVFRIFVHDLPIWNYLLSFLVGGAIIYVIGIVSSYVLKKEAMGGGDVKLFAFVGLMLGFKLLLLSIFLASLSGLLFGTILLLTRKTKPGSYIPFGPYIALGSLVSYGWGNRIMDWYLSFIP